MNAVAEHYRNVLDGQQLAGAGIDWLDKLRADAFAVFEEAGFPQPRNEAWKYTKVQAIAKRQFQAVPEACIGLDEDDIAKYVPDMDCYRLAFVNGQFMPMLSTKKSELPEGATVTSLARQLADNPDVMKDHLGQIADYKANGFAALNAASISDGAFVHLPANKVLDKPVHLLFITTASGSEIACHPRNLIVAEANTEASVMESFVSLGDANYLTNAVTEVSLADNARVKHYKLQDESTKAYHIATLQVQQERSSVFSSHAVSIGANIARQDINSVLDAEGAECYLDGLYNVSGRQHVDFHTRVDHAKPQCTSAEFYKGIMDGHSRGVFNGKIYVAPDAQQTDSSQSNANLLLSDNAEIDTKPELEIYADDVKAAHGATVGQLDEKSIFYLRSRGIDADSARSLLTYAFAGEVIERAASEPWRDFLRDQVMDRLPHGKRIRELM